MALCLGSGLALIAGVTAQELSTTNPTPAGNPYGTIAARNVFGLISPAAPPDPAAAAEKNLPKITPNGLMSAYGRWKVLFKTSGGGGAGGPAKDKYYDLAEGQTEDGIQVAGIDAQKCLVTFDNHGVIQELPLASAGGSEGASGADGVPGGADARPKLFAGAHLRAGAGGADPWRPGGPFNAEATGADGSPGP